MFAEIQRQYPSLNLYAYDVVNEAVSDDANRTRYYGGAREPGYGNGRSPWVQIYGDNKFIEKALHMQENMLRQIVSFTTTITTNIGIIRETVLPQFVQTCTTRACLTVWECSPILMRI